MGGGGTFSLLPESIVSVASSSSPVSEAPANQPERLPQHDGPLSIFSFSNIPSVAMTPSGCLSLARFLRTRLMDETCGGTHVSCDVSAAARMSADLLDWLFYQMCEKLVICFSTDGL